jgi:hypothetical protein
MRSPHHLTRSQAPAVVPFVPKPPLRSLEQMGIGAGSPILETAEEQAERERIDRQRIADGTKAIDTAPRRCPCLSMLRR